MKKFLSILIICVVLCSVLVFNCSAQIYQSAFPSYCSISGGAFAEVQSNVGRACIVIANNYILDTFSFNGSTGYNILNVTSNNISGKIYFQNNTNFYGNGKEFDCRFNAFGTLELYEPYMSGTRLTYRWTAVSISQIYNTNIGFLDNSADRQNNDYIYTRPEKINIIIMVLICCIFMYFILGRCWHA